jgi:ribosomal protein S18 acetylase RimI-like enzyme
MGSLCYVVQQDERIQSWMTTAIGSQPDGLRIATIGDAAALTALINLAFKKESFFKKGDRIDEPQVVEKFSTGEFYVIERESEIIGCVYIEVAREGESHLIAKGEGAGYIGMLAVDPARQGSGIGKQLMAFAEAELQRRGCTRIQLRIVNLRTELLEFYGRQGYRETGTTPYPFPNKLTMPVHFIDMEKQVG